MTIQVYINNQFLIAYKSKVLGLCDDTNFKKFDKLEHKYEYRENIIDAAVLQVQHIMQKFEITGYVMAVVIPSTNGIKPQKKRYAKK